MAELLRYHSLAIETRSRSHPRVGGPAASPEKQRGLGVKLTTCNAAVTMRGVLPPVPHASSTLVLNENLQKVHVLVRCAASVSPRVCVVCVCGVCACVCVRGVVNKFPD